MATAIKVENLSKIYRLGEIGTGTISRDIERFVKTKILKQEDPFLKIGEANDTATKGASDIVYSLNDINFEIEQGDAVGIIGRNGAGKSTLLKILSRVTSPTTGKINIKGRVASLLEVGTGFHPELTGRENIYLNGSIMGMRKKEITKKIEEIIDFSGVERYVDTPVKRYSSGMYVRLAFAVAAHLESEILIVDEVLAVGDAEFQKKCLGKMNDVSKGEGRTVLFVSHNMSSIKKMCRKGLYLQDGEIIMYDEVNNVIENYLQSANLVRFKEGNVPDGTSSINTGILRFQHIRINENQNTVGYNDSFKFELNIFSKLDINDCFIDIRFLNNEMIEICHSTHAYSSEKPFISISQGENKFEVEIENNLQPGNFFITIGIHKKNGETLEYVEQIGPIEVLTVSSLNEFDHIFPINWPLTNLRAKSKWKQVK
jgi:lipopolysaccharide transport system ATP-binding protein